LFLLLFFGIGGGGFSKAALAALAGLKAA